MVSVSRPCLLGSEFDFSKLDVIALQSGKNGEFGEERALWEEACAHDGNPMRKVCLIDISSLGHGKNHKQCTELSFVGENVLLVP